MPISRFSAYLNNIIDWYIWQLNISQVNKKFIHHRVKSYCKLVNQFEHHTNIPPMGPFVYAFKLMH